MIKNPPPAPSSPVRRGRTGCKPDIATTLAMYELYKQGKTCWQISLIYKVTRQSVWDRLRRQGFKLRPYPRNLALPFIEFDGARYAPGKDNYFRKTDGDRMPLHRAMWIKAHGRITRGHTVYFMDGDRMNCVLENLLSGPKGEEIRVRPIKLKMCLACGEWMGRRSTGNTPEPPSAYAKRKTCNPQCSGNWKKGRPRRTRMPK